MLAYALYLDAHSRGTAARLGSAANFPIPAVPSAKVPSLRHRAAVALGLYHANNNTPPVAQAQVRSALDNMLDVKPKKQSSPAAETLMGDLPAVPASPTKTLRGFAMQGAK